MHRGKVVEAYEKKPVIRFVKATSDFHHLSIDLRLDVLSSYFQNDGRIWYTNVSVVEEKD